MGEKLCMLSYTDKVITLTEQGKSELDCYGYRGEVDIIPNGADLSRFTPTESEKKIRHHFLRANREP